MTSSKHRIWDILDRILNSAVIILGILILFISCYSLLDNLRQYQGAATGDLIKFKPALDEPIPDDAFISPDQAAWLYIDDTSIDYPVMQGRDNFEYLNKDPYGEFKLSGSIFLDYRNDRDFLDQYSVIYGHHMEHRAMFGMLDSYKERAFFDEHSHGYLVTGTTVYDMTIFAVCSADATEPVIFDPRGRLTSEVTAFLKERAYIFVEPDETLRIVALSTCTGDASLERLIVFGTIRAR